jgi:hypothetical protein
LLYFEDPFAIDHVQNRSRRNKVPSSIFNESTILIIHSGRVCRHGPAAWLRSRAAVPVFASSGWLESQAVRVQIESLSLAPQKRAQGPFPESLAARGARIPRLDSFGLLAWLHIG